MRKITREEPPKNPSKKEKPTKEENTIVRKPREKETKEEKIPSKGEKEEEKLEDKPETLVKRNLKYKANKVIESNTKDLSTLV
jgi:hypothetical protein